MLGSKFIILKYRCLINAKKITMVLNATKVDTFFFQAYLSTAQQSYFGFILTLIFVFTFIKDSYS
jgi:hypothetical protein